MEEEKIKMSRKGFHKYFHVSKLDTYIYAGISICLFALVCFKVSNKIFDWGLATPIIAWIDALQLAILFAILGFVSHQYYLKHEEKYDR